MLVSEQDLAIEDAEWATTTEQCHEGAHASCGGRTLNWYENSAGVGGYVNRCRCDCHSATVVTEPIDITP